MSQEFDLIRYSRGASIAFYVKAKDLDGSVLDDGSTVEVTISETRGGAALVEGTGTVVSQASGRYLVSLSASGLTDGTTYYVAIWSNHGTSKSALQARGTLIIDDETEPT